jgi:hypothetical protein
VIIQTRSKTIQKPAPVFQNNRKKLRNLFRSSKIRRKHKLWASKARKSTNFSFSNPKTAKSHTENPIYSKTFTRHESQNSSFPIENSEKQENLFENSIKTCHLINPTVSYLRLSLLYLTQGQNLH